MTSYVVDIARCGGEQRALVGGKAAALGEVAQAGFPVPPGFAVTTLAHAEFLAAAPRGERADREVAIPGAIAEAVTRAYEGLAAAGHGVVAVRSSATAEDLDTASFAGQQESYLGIRDASAVLDAVRRCWSSLFTTHARAYRARLGIADDAARMAVVVQAMVPARVAGVTFSLNPVNGDRSKIAVEACWGLGQRLMAGDITPDRYLVDKVTLGVLSRAVTRQDVEERLDGTSVVATAVPPDRRDAPCMADEEVIEVARLAQRLEQLRGHAVDVEWAVAAGERFAEALRVVQVRPETVWSRRPAAPVVPCLESSVDYIVHFVMGGKAAASVESG
jgi:phosphoenolpyruvate synthase/pyruvate phosphate dikinase